MPPPIYSPWAKFCGKGNQPGVKEVSFTSKDAALSENSGNSFQAANESPPTPKMLEEQQKKLQEDLQKRANELRKKLESQAGTGPSAPLRKEPGLLPACLPDC